MVEPAKIFVGLVLFTLGSAFAGCSLLFDTDYDKYGPPPGVVGGDASDGASDGASDDASDGASDDASDGASDDASDGPRDGGSPLIDAPPPGEVCNLMQPSCATQDSGDGGTDHCEARSVRGGYFPMGPPPTRRQLPRNAIRMSPRTAWTRSR